MSAENAVALIGLVLGASAASGLRLYATVAVLGFLGRAGVVTLPGALGVLAHDGVIAAASALYLVEFFADKIPLVDSAWDFVHTFVRVPAAVLLAWAALAQIPDAWRLIAALVCGGVAFSAHGLKAGARAALNLSPEPVTNWLASLGEDGLTALLLYLAVRHPLAASLLAVAIVILAAVLGAWLWRSFRKVLRGRPPAAA